MVCGIDVEDTCPSLELPCIEIGEARLVWFIGCGTQAKSGRLWQRRGM